MARLAILFVCGLLPAALSQCNVQRAQPFLKRSAYEFAIQLTERIAQEKDNHFAASTLSAWSLLSTAALGAGGATLEEFRKVLGLHRQPCFNDRYMELVKPVRGGGVDVERSSTIFVADGLPVRDEFQRRVRTAGAGDLVVLPFDNPETVAATISDYVSRATHNAIADLVAPADLEGVYLIMIDALYFKGSWRTPFPYESTEIAPFYDDAGGRAGDVNMMKTVGAFRVTDVELLDASVLELPFGAEGRHAMLVFLPQRNATLSAVIDSMKSVSLATVYALFARESAESVAVEIPKFAVTSDLDNLKDLLMDMGLRAAFDSSEAQFPYLSDEPLYVSNIVQKASVEISEAGAEASAGTAGFFSSRSGPQEFRVDRPFFYMIVDTVTQVPLFTGAYSQPSLYAA